MNKEVQRYCVAVLVLSVVANGCVPTRRFYFFKHEDMTNYRQVAAEIETPGEPVCCQPPRLSGPPITPDTFENTQLRDLSLQEALGIAMTNSEIVRRLPAAGPPTALLDNPQSLTTSYDPAIQSTTTFGVEGIGVEAALSAFDAQFSSSMFWERNERPINVGGFIGNSIFAADLGQDRGTFQSELSKTNAAGGRTFVRNNVRYDGNNNPTQGVPSSFNVDYEIGITQPLLKGAGVAFNRIAGPQSAGQTGFANGVLIARINQDLSLADFEKAVRDTVFDVEKAYWDLYVTYRTFESTRTGRDSALATWRRVKDFQKAGVIGGEAVALAQARSQFYRFRGDMDVALCSLLEAENRLRYLLGMPPSDGKLIRPKDDPRRAKIVFDWEEIQLESLARSVELRRQKWTIKRRELQLIAARNALLPRLDAVALYRWLGAGDRLIDSNGRGVPAFRGSNAFSTLTSGDYQEWQLGFQFSMPLGYRQELASVRNAQLQLARERARLRGQELELSHALTDSVRSLACDYLVAQRRLNEWLSTQEEVERTWEIWKSGLQRIGRGEVRSTDVIDAIAKRARAETDYYQTLINYNISISGVHYRKGSLLEYNGIYLAEGPWPQKAYRDAREKAMRRASAGLLNYVMHPTPGLISRGLYPQQSAEVPTNGAPVQKNGPPQPVEELPLSDGFDSDGIPAGDLSGKAKTASISAGPATSVTFPSSVNSSSAATWPTLSSDPVQDSAVDRDERAGDSGEEPKAKRRQSLPWSS